MAAFAILTHVMAARPRCQIGGTVETQSRQVMALVAGAAGHRQHDGMLRRRHRSAAERGEAHGVAVLAGRRTGRNLNRQENVGNLIVH